MLIMPYEQFEMDVLDALLNEIVTRDGTDYGDVEFTQAQKVEQVMLQLKQRAAYICFESISETCTIISKDQAREEGLLND